METSNTQARFTMAELVDFTGLPDRTIRFYISEGLVSPAFGKGRSSYYTVQHTEELARITHLRDQRLTLDEIRATLTQTGPATHEPEPDYWERIILHSDLELVLHATASESTRALARELRERALEWYGAEDI